MDVGPDRRHHFVPQFYLRKFASDRRHERIWCFDKSDGAITERRIKNVAYRFGLYSLRGDTEREREGLEREFRDHETRWAEALHATVATGAIARAHRMQLTEFVVTQLARGPWFRDSYLEKFDLNGATWGEVLAEMLNSQVLRDFMGALYDQIWVLGVARFRRYCTSDTPALAIGPENAPRRVPMPPAAEFVFPLSPTTCLRIYERGHFSHRAYLDGKSATFISDAVSVLNSVQVLAARELIFGQVEEFDEALTVVRRQRKHPFSDSGTGRVR